MTAEERFEKWWNTLEYPQVFDRSDCEIAWLACEAARDAEIERVATELDDLGDHRPAHICKVSDAYYSAAKIVRSLRSRITAKPETTTPDRPRTQYCDSCDGCGWYEGGVAIQTHCEKCNGTGVIEL